MDYQKSVKRRKWRKNLYENTEYEDNYTDPTFLKDLRTNLTVRFFTFGEAVRGITRLNNQISCITAFLVIFYLLHSGRVTPSKVLVPTAALTILGYICCCGRQLSASKFIDDSKTLITVLLFGYIFAPLLHGLTDAISTDTIFVMTFVVMVLNLAFHDYGLSVAMVSNTLSVNAAIFGSICLASRLATSYHAYVLLVAAAIMFVLYPLFVCLYWRWQLFLPICGILVGTLYWISQPVMILYIIVTVFINFMCPWIFVTFQRYKHNIHGPWDEAIVEETDETNIAAKL